MSIESTSKLGEIKSETSLSSSPYTLYGSDNPGAMITPVMLNGDNYNLWANEMLNALKAKRKTGFINGTLKKPLIDDPDYENWIAVNSMIIGWIRASIDPKVKSSVSFISEAHQLWSELKQRFSVGNKVRIHQIKAQLASCHQDGQSVIEYYGRLCTLWEEYAVYKPLPMCTCGASNEISTDRDEEKVHQFVLGLDDSRYGGLCTTLIGLDPMPSIGEVYSRVIREEQRLNASRVRENQQEAVGFVTRQTSPRSEHVSYQSDRAKNEVSLLRPRSTLCSHCGRTGHDKKDCWSIVGFPEWWNERPGGRGQGMRGRGRGSAGRGRGQVMAAHATSSNASVFHDFSAEQWKILSQMVSEKQRNGGDKLSGKMKYGNVILDTGASHHMTGESSLLVDIVSIPPCSIGFADGNKTFAVHMGSFPLSDKVKLTNVLYVPSLNCTLISVSKILKQTGCFAMFTDTICVLQDRFSRTLIGRGEERDGVYYLTDVATAKIHTVSASPDQTLWHRRLGHPSFSVFSALPMISNFPSSKSSSPCDVCFRAKQTREVFPDSINKASDCFELIHCDVWGPYRVPSSCGAVYFLTIVDDFSRAVWTHLLLAKSEVRSVLINFLSYAEKQFGKTVKIIRSDNGTEFMCLSSYFKEHGIIHQTSCVGTPQQNGRVERKHRHILNVSRALLFQANLPVKFWGEAVLTAAYLINRTPTTLHKGRSPYELLHGCKPDYTQLRVFGSACYAHHKSRTRDKFGERSRMCVFMGYPFGKKGWKVYDIDRNEFLVSRDVIFREDIFPYVSSQAISPPILTPSIVDEDWLAAPVPTERGSISVDRDIVGVEVVVPVLEEVSSNGEAVSVSSHDENTTVALHDSSLADDANVSPSEGIIHESTVTLSEEEHLGRGCRVRKPSIMLKDYVTYNASCDPNTHTHHASPDSTSLSSSSVQGNSLYPLTNYVSDDNFSPQHKAFLAAITSSKEPKNFKEAVQIKVWNESMTKEIAACEAHNTWDIVDLPKGKVALGSQWVYRTKYNADGSIERYKSRLVIQGNQQIEGEDYNETFAPVVRLTTVRTLLRLVAANQWEVYQMDVHNAFLNGDLEEEVYMKLPPGFRHSHPDKVCRLKKSLYGLKQAPRCWFKKLSDALLRFGFVQSYDDYSLFSYSRKGLEIRVLIYVDDLLITGNDKYMLQKFKDYLGKCFSMKDLGKLKYFLGIEVSRGPEGIFLTQRKYALDIIADSGCLGSKPAVTPLEQNHHLASSTSPFLDDPTKYRRLIGRLIYLTHTRPELSYSVHLLSQFMQKPREDHWASALRVIRYLKGSPGLGIFLKANKDLSLTIYCDADWSSCPLTRRSLSAFVVLLGGSPISWRTKKQDTVSHSSAEAEYRSMADALREVKWLRSLLKELGVEQTAPTRFFCDSKAAIHIAANPVFHERTKHVENDCHSVRDAVKAGIIVTHHIRTKDQVADILTKALGRAQFETLLSKLGVQDLHAPT